MSAPAGKCVFCGGPKLTKGHIWPDWLDKYLPPRADYYVQTIGEANTFLPQMRRPQVESRRRHGDARARRPRNTCLVCNGGWMSRLESEAMGPAIPLIVGKPYESGAEGHSYMLNAFGQRALASLLCLITMRAEFMHAPTQAASATDRLWIRDRLEPPPFWQAWIARYVGAKAPEHWCRHYGMQLVSSPTEVSGTPKCETQTSTFVLGQLCAHVFSSRSIPDFAGYSGADLCKIWPPTGWDIDCRFLPAIRDAGVLSLSEALAREIPPVPVSE
jgi:hypothetical protein